MTGRSLALGCLECQSSVGSKKSNSNHMLANTYIHVAHTYAQPIQFCCIVLSLQVTIRTPISHTHSFPGFPPGSNEEGTSHLPSPLQGRLKSSFLPKAGWNPVSFGTAASFSNTIKNILSFLLSFLEPASYFVEFLACKFLLLAQETPWIN